jgi:hypothetical protein
VSGPKPEFLDCPSKVAQAEPSQSTPASAPSSGSKVCGCGDERIAIVTVDGTVICGRCFGRILGPHLPEISNDARVSFAVIDPNLRAEMLRQQQQRELIEQARIRVEEEETREVQEVQGGAATTVGNIRGMPWQDVEELGQKWRDEHAPATVDKTVDLKDARVDTFLEKLKRRRKKRVHKSK